MRSSKVFVVSGPLAVTAAQVADIEARAEQDRRALIVAGAGTRARKFRQNRPTIINAIIRDNGWTPGPQAYGEAIRTFEDEARKVESDAKRVARLFAPTGEGTTF